MTNKKDSYMNELLKSLFGGETSLFTFKILTEEEAKILRSFGYNPFSWDILLESGKLTKEDVQKRVTLSKQLDVLDKNLKERLDKKEETTQPEFKKGDALKTKKWGTIVITKVNPSGYQFFTENGFQADSTEEFLLAQLGK